MMGNNEKERLDKFEMMLSAVQLQYDEKTQKMAELKSAGKEKTATYRQLFGEKIQLGNMISMYRFYGLIE
ncbi:MAG: hypothetical protein ACI4JS_04165 [Oscillospiraceae bacterium]